MLEIQVPLTECIGEAFYDMHWDIQDHLHTYYNLTGGRGSLKSSVIALEIVLEMMKPEHNNRHAVIYRAVKDTLETSVYSQIAWAIDKLRVGDRWLQTKSPMRFTYKPTGQMIIFRGLDSAAKSKSIKLPFGYIGYLWYEELDEYRSAAEIRKVQQSIIRGGSEFLIFKSMNPPKSKRNWANEYIENERLRPDTYTSHTTYLTSPRDWIGEQFIQDAEWLKETSPDLYRHEYLGEVVGYGTEVFNNIISRRITDEEIAGFDHIYMGVDWGYYPDPYHWGKMHFDSNRRMLYIFDEYRAWRTGNRETADYLMKHKGVTSHDLITCDSAEKKSTADYKSYGINARDAIKGAGSVEYGIKWLQSLAGIVIDPVRCPNTHEEFNRYEYEKDKDGNPINVLPDMDNHSIDMTRYAMERVSSRRGL